MTTTTAQTAAMFKKGQGVARLAWHPVEGVTTLNETETYCRTWQQALEWANSKGYTLID